MSKPKRLVKWISTESLEELSWFHDKGSKQSLLPQVKDEFAKRESQPIQDTLDVDTRRYRGKEKGAQWNGIQWRRERKAIRIVRRLLEERFHDEMTLNLERTSNKIQKDVERRDTTIKRRPKADIFRKRDKDKIRRNDRKAKRNALRMEEEKLM